MTLAEFENKYYLHDSNIEKILYDSFEFVRYEPGEDIYPTMKIKADNVGVKELERYNL